MSVGFPTDKVSIDARAGDLARRVRDVLTDVQRFQAFLAGKTDAELVALGYTQADVTLLKSAYTQLDSLRTLATGGSTQATANNFLYFSNQLLGPN